MVCNFCIIIVKFIYGLGSLIVGLVTYVELVFIGLTNYMRKEFDNE